MGATNDCLCCDSLRISSILSKLEIFLWIILFVLTFVLQKDLKDPIWLASSISIFVFLLVNTSFQIYGLSSKNFCILLSSALSRFFIISLGNLAVIILACFVIPRMKVDQHIYLAVGVPILAYNFMMSLILFKAIHRIRKQEKLEESFKNRHHIIHHHDHYQSKVSIPYPDFSTPPESLQYPSASSGYVSQSLYPVFQYPSNQQSYIYNPASASYYPPLQN